MTIEVGTDPTLPVVLTGSINANGALEIKYGTDSLTHPQQTELRVDTDDLDTVTFQTADFYVGTVRHSVSATTIDGESWNGGGSSIVSEQFTGESDPGKLHEVNVSATDTSTNQTATTTIRLRIREQTVRPLP